MIIDEVSERREPTDEIEHGLPLKTGQEAMLLVNKALEILLDRLESAAPGKEDDLRAWVKQHGEMLKNLSEVSMLAAQGAGDGISGLTEYCYNQLHSDEQEMKAMGESLNTDRLRAWYMVPQIMMQKMRAEFKKYKDVEAMDLTLQQRMVLERKFANKRYPLGNKDIMNVLKDTVELAQNIDFAKEY